MPTIKVSSRKEPPAVKSDKKSARVYKCSPDLERFLVPLGSLKPDPNNARLHPERSIAALVAALTRFGYQKSIVIGAGGVVIAGNGILMAATRMGWTHIPAVKTELRGDDLAAYAIADNRVAELSEWDGSRLIEQLRNDEPSAVGFTTSEIERMVESMNPELPKEFSVMSAEDVHTEHTCPGCGFQWSGKTK